MKLFSLTLLFAFAATFPAIASGATVHDGDRTFRVTETEHDTNICGLPATFDFVVSDRWHSVEANDGFHFTETETARWTVTFDDASLGVWEGKSAETTHFVLTPGGLQTFHSSFNGSEGPVRITEHQTVVAAADGTLSVDMDQITTTFERCPA
jgi:hypothetical protein